MKMCTIITPTFTEAQPKAQRGQITLAQCHTARNSRTGLEPSSLAPESVLLAVTVKGHCSQTLKGREGEP